VILRSNKKSRATATALVTVDNIRILEPFRQLNDAMLDTIASHTEIIRPKKQSWMPDKADSSIYFLHNGELSFSTESAPPRVLKAKSAAAYFPLPTSKRITASAETLLLKVPARYLMLDQEHMQDDNSEAIQLQEDNVSGEVYLEFYRSLKSGKYDLPSMPDLAIRIGKAIDDPNTMNDDIARLIQMDPALTARVMSVVNSAAFGAAEPIRTLKQAVTRMGRQQVRNLVFSCIIKGLFRTDSPLLKERMERLWAHSCRVAAISFVLAKVTPGLDPNRALLAGLIHDIGGIPILHAARNNPQVADDAVLLDQVIESLKAEIGALTLTQWGFDPEMIDLALHAEQWQRTGTALPDYIDAVLLAQLHAFIGTQSIQEMPPIDQIPAFKKLALGKLTPTHSIGVLEHASKDINEVESLLHHG